MLDSDFSSKFCMFSRCTAQSDFLVMWTIRIAIPHVLSQVHMCLFLHPHTPFFFGFTSLETNHQLLDFDLNFGPAIKDNKVSSTERVTNFASLNMLTMLKISWFLLVHWLSVPFRALWIALLATFLEVKYFPISLISSISPPPSSLHDWLKLMCAFLCLQ